MYLFFGIFLFFCILFFLLNHHRRKCIIQKICCMDFCEKFCLLNDLMRPYGFSFLPKQDIVTSRKDAWQREFGYSSLFDQTASRFNMVFDCEPIYFDYEGRTWRIEFWKGQYGINIGSEIGIYCADSLLAASQYEYAHFQSVPDDRMPFMEIELFYKNESLFSVSSPHWWLTGFSMGRYCEPEDLSMQISITFPNRYMLQSFAEALLRRGYDRSRISIRYLAISFSFVRPFAPQPRSPFFSRLSQWKNRQFCRLYQSVTRPFPGTMDKLLYLYFFLPRTFRRMLRFKKNRIQKYR